MLSLLLPNFGEIELIQTCTYRMAIWESTYADNNEELIW